MIRGIEEAHLPPILALNNIYATETSELDHPALADMIKSASVVLQAGDGRDGFVIAFEKSAPYSSPNYRWLAERYSSFLYIDRIVVAKNARGRGLARRFYKTLLLMARDTGLCRVVCEVNQVPPNPASDAFHAKMGFGEVGMAAHADGSKAMRYLILPIT